MAVRRIALAFLIMLVPLAGDVGAVEPDEILSDPRLEARAREISTGLRCLVCQNQSIDDSNAPLAKDLRVLVRERLKAGDSDEDVLSFVVSRYGEFVLLQPRFAIHTLLLWLGPIFVLLGAGWFLYRGALRMRRGAGSASPSPELSEAEKQKLEELLGADER